MFKGKKDFDFFLALVLLGKEMDEEKIRKISIFSQIVTDFSQKWK